MNQPTMTLSEMLGLVKDAVNMMFEEGLWLTAEILNSSGSRGHTYLELVEYDASRSERAKIRGTIWKGNASILTKFQKATSNPLSSGMKILFKAVPTFHEIYGLSLTITDIDPNYTLGDMAARLNEIRKNLQEKGWWERNRSLETPREFCHVAVISPADAAGLGDFRVVADKLEKAGICNFEYFGAAFQGQESANQIVDQMVKVLDAHKENPFDCLAVIRGGGDKAGLYQLNNARLAAAFCRFPLPILVGIGHERDSVILDEVANKRFPTPSQLIDHVRHTIIQNAQKALSDWERIKHLSDLALTRAHNACDSQVRRLVAGSIRQTDNAQSKVSAQGTRLTHASSLVLNTAEQRIEKQQASVARNALAVCVKAEQKLDGQKDRLMREADSALITAEHLVKTKGSAVMTANPIAILGRGYAYVKQGNRIITKVSQVAPGDTVHINLKEGSIAATVKDEEK